MRVLDLTRVRAGPTCCRILADFGADVIKVEAPAGVDPNANMSGERHGYDMLNLHRNKRSLTLNLKKPEGKALFLRLVRDADVVVENFRPDVKERLGIAYDDLKAENPRVILASISGFGQTGPYRMRAGFDQIAQGMGGLMGVTGLPGQGPVRAGIAVADSTAGVYAACGILVALAEREQSGKGQWLHTSLLESMIAMMDFQAARYLIDGEVPGQAGNDHPYSTPMGVVETADGHINIAVGGESQWPPFCRAIGRPEYAKDPRFATQGDRFANRPALTALLKEIFSEKPSEEWLSVLEDHGVPCGPINGIDAVFADPQVRHLGVAKAVEHRARGPIRVVATPITMSRTPSSIRTPSPDPGEHTDEILGEAGLTIEEIGDLRAKGAI
ncbi:CaiB/BaiF CoA transferase family protein [Jiella pelagia]|uniref:CoA transferase n=1 Tax=Jiella pelagia TaxID=2986949 RepID=A0ABY7C6E0_9HYPH|nr:CoA transferase [Jiella pelagia]WAP71336.1 CoA transferase [Jiella pelagia]